MLPESFDKSVTRARLRVRHGARRGEARELVFQGYRIIYRVRPDRVQVLNVLHGSRDLSRMKPKPWNIG
ncbi:MAG: type II toxin-antitoxin system RelE/ParE family toxin [Gammaproteobacteria bacterium]